MRGFHIIILNPHSKSEMNVKIIMPSPSLKELYRENFKIKSFDSSLFLHLNNLKTIYNPFLSYSVIKRLYFPLDISII